jgi:hypothetical protein
MSSARGAVRERGREGRTPEGKGVEGRLHKVGRDAHVEIN